ncbi:metallophosphatase, partial [Rhizobium leguminosarum]
GYRLVAERLLSLDCPVHLLPGNGDDAQLMRSELAAVCTWINATGSMHFRTSVDGLTLFGVDVTVAGQSYGDVQPHQPRQMR